MGLLPHLHLKDLYGGFHVSVGLLFWAYASGLILFAGAQFSVARWGTGRASEPSEVSCCEQLVRTEGDGPSQAAQQLNSEGDGGINLGFNPRIKPAESAGFSPETASPN